jgi:flagellar basal-body rod modification protein FlgD
VGELSTVSQSVSSLLSNNSPYSVSAKVGEGEGGWGIDPESTKYSKEPKGELWKGQKELGKDDFLLLLVTQMKYQDPLSPMENTEFVSQLAQFRSLETAENTERAIKGLEDVLNENISYQIIASQSISNFAAASFIGKDVRMLQPAVEWKGKDGDTLPIRVHLGSKSEVTVDIKDSDGKVVRTFEVKEKDAENSGMFQWDGKDNSGQLVKNGRYMIEVQGQDKDSSLYSFAQAIVEGVRFTPTGVLVKIEGREISIGELLDVSRGDEGHAAQSGAIALMGKLIRARHERIVYGAKDNEEHGIHIQAAVNQQVTVEIRDSAGKVVKTLKDVAGSDGKLLIFWDGTNDGGDKAAVGEYRINVVGSDKNPGLYAYTEGIVDGLTSLTGDFKLKVNGREVALSDVMDISTPKA